MLQEAQNVDSKGFSIDRSRNALRFERELQAPAGDVFDAWTDPSQIRLWWDPTGDPLRDCQIDLREGGAFSFVTQAHSDRPFTGVYRQIDRPALLVFDAMGAEGRVELSEAAGKTAMIVEIICRDEQHLEQFVQMGAAEGTSRTLDNLVRYKG
jgi:uncharacterized protein YndB with AHSA1/START domain